MLRQSLFDIVESFVPTQRVSQFETKGVITPEEFLTAGDNLIAHTGSLFCWSPTFSPVSFLPNDKQVLICRNIPWKSIQDVDKANRVVNEHIVTEFSSGDWILPSLKNEMQDSKDDYTDLISFMGTSFMKDKSLIIPPSPRVKKVASKSYTVIFEYSKLFRTVKLYLKGYNGTQPLTAEEMLVDVPLNERDIVSLEMHKFESEISEPYLAFHPCNQSSSLLTLMKSMKEFPSVQQFMVLHLKLLTSILPNLAIDSSSLRLEKV